jgi:predicted alpha/beta-fold hydrolase
VLRFPPDSMRMPYAPSDYHPLFTGGHAQTLYAWARTRHLPRLPAPVERYFDVAADARVLAHCHWHDTPADHPTIMVLHGLEGSSTAHYMRGRRQSLGRRVERRPSQSAQLRSH